MGVAIQGDMAITCPKKLCALGWDMLENEMWQICRVPHHVQARWLMVGNQVCQRVMCAKIFSHLRISTYIITIFPQAFQVCVSIFIHLICVDIYITKGSCFKKLVLPSCFHSRIYYVLCSCTYFKLKVL
jgi:hypothetical protein